MNRKAIIMGKLLWCCAAIFFFVAAGWGQNQLRNRGETFYESINSNTVGAGDIWVRATALAHVWDNPPTDSGGGKHIWFSNVRAFPELQIQYGLFDITTITVESRPLTWAWKPGFVSVGAKLTTPDNKNLRLSSVGFEVKYRYNFTQGPPTLGGYSGFMPEGYVIKGNNIEAKVAYELDVLPVLTFLPLRLLVDVGGRLPLKDSVYQNFQILAHAALIYSGYGFDFFGGGYIESFDNFTQPKIMSTGGSRFLVFFTENPIYAFIGGNERYDNGMELSVCVPILLSVNQESRNSGDITELNRKEDPSKFPIEKSLGITNPFDPWFVKWKVVVSLTLPIHAKMTSAEMMRNFLMGKNRKQRKRIDIDNRLQTDEQKKPTVIDQEKDNQKRLEEIRKRRQKSVEETPGNNEEINQQNNEESPVQNNEEKPVQNNEEKPVEK
jgi:hypothetical protein